MFFGSIPWLCTFLTTSWVMFVFFAFFVRENKNRYVLAFLKSLVDCGLFEHIYLNFLPVGHTHCDIDQLFSRIAVWMRGMKPCSNNLESDEPKVIMFMPPVVAHEAYTWDELAAAIRQAYKDITQVYVLPKLINWSESIHPYVNDASKTPGFNFSAFCSTHVGPVKYAQQCPVYYIIVCQDLKDLQTTDASMCAKKL